MLRLCAAADHPSDAPAPPDRSAGPIRGVRGRHPYVLALTVILLVWGVFLIGAGTLVSGYQFTDDHEILRIDAEIHAPGGSAAGVARSWGQRDLTIRFRPAYYAHRVALVSLFGTNLEVWGIHQGALGVLAAFLLFAFCLRLGFTWGQAMVFALLVLMGRQATVFWRTGPPEALGTPMAALTMWLMGESVFRPTRRRMWLTLFLISAGVMSLCKESFVLLLPALAFWRVWLTKTASTGMTWTEAARRNAVPAVVLCVLCVAETAFTALFVGTTVAGYAGVDRINLLAAMAQLCDAFMFSYIYLAILGFVIIAVIAVRRERRLDWAGLGTLREYAPAAILCGLIVLPQAVLYTKSGFFERYLIPAVIGFAFILVWTLRWMAGRERRLAMGFMALLCVYGAFQTMLAFGHARYWAAVGRQNEEFLAMAGRTARADSKLLIVGDPARNQEDALAVKSWLETRIGCRDLYVLRVLTPPYTPFERGLLAGPEFGQWFPGRVFDDPAKIPPPDVVLVLEDVDTAFTPQSAPWLTRTAYDRIEIAGPSGLVLYTRRTP